MGHSQGPSQSVKMGQVGWGWITKDLTLINYFKSWRGIERLNTLG